MSLENQTPDKKKKKFNVLYLFSFLVPVLIMLTVFVSIGIYPFGEKSLLTVDLYHQYIDFFSYLRFIFMGDANIFYSFSKSLGGNMIGLFAYYLASPLNIIFIFFKQEYMAEAILVLTLLKIGLCGLTFSIMCNKIFGKLNYFNLIFSSCYALMAYNIVFAQNIMWLDGVIWLPIVILGLYNLIDNGGVFTYIFSLTMVMLSNYYIGYMVCIFSVLYFIYQMIISGNKDAKFVGKKILTFIGCSLLCASIAAALLLPTFLSLRNGKAEFNKEIFTLAENFDFAHFLQKMYIGEMDIDLLHQGLKTTLPDIFCGTITTLLCFLYFFNKKIRNKEKLCSVIMLFILILSFHIKSFDLIWHGFNTPVGFLYRNSFIFSFFCVYIGYKCFINYDGITVGNVLSSIGLFILISIITDKVSLESLTTAEIYMTVAFFIAYGIVISMLISGKNQIVAFILLLSFFAFELEIYGYLTLENLSHVSREVYVENVVSTKAVSKKISNMDDSFYRIDKTFMRSHNDGMQHNYNTITHSSSTADYPVVNFLNKLGFRSDSDIGNSYDYGSTLIANSLLNIKYIADNTGRNFKYYKNYGNIDETVIYKNPYALPLMFKANQQILNTEYDYDILSMQNQIIKDLTGMQNNDVLKLIQPDDVVMHNLTTESNGAGTTYSKINPDETAYIEFELTAINNEEIYAHFPTEPISDSTVDVYINGVHQRTHFDSNHLTYYDILNLGAYSKGEKIKLKFVLQLEQTNFETSYFYALDLENFEKAFQKLSSNTFEFNVHSDSYITADIKGLKSEELIFTTIPYDKGWDVYVDGTKIEPEVVLDTLMAFKLNEGDHRLELKYTPPGLKLGVVITIISLLIVGILVYFNKKALKKKGDEKDE